MHCVFRMSDTTVHQNSQLSKVPFTMRAIDAVDRTHARAATVLHGVRNDVRGTLERVLDRAQELTLAAFARVRSSVQKADAVSADVVNRAQGVVNHALDMAREAGTKRAHLPS